MNEIRLIALDLDKTTLRSDKTLSEENRRAIQDAIAAGIHVVVASGRPFVSLPREILEIPGIEYAVTANGAAVYRLDTGERIHEYLLGEDAVTGILEQVPGKNEMGTYIQGVPYAWQPYVEDPARYGASAVESDYIQTTRCKVEDIRKFIWEHRKELDSLDIIVSSEEEHLQIRAKLEQNVPGIYVTSSVLQLLEISNELSGKRSGVAWLCEKLGIPASAAAAFGDAENDEDMIRYVGLGIAVGNASAQVKEAADWIVPGNDEDGVAYGIRRILKEGV